MKLPKRRRRVVAVEAPRRVRRMGPGQGSISGGPGGRNGDGKCQVGNDHIPKIWH